jgi:hypothetical protein
MSEQPKIAIISAQINDGEYSPISLQLKMDVNTFPSATVNIAEAKEKVSVKTPVSNKVIDRIGKLQSQRLAGRQEPDFKVTAEDGIGGSMTFSGYIVTPILEITKYTTIDRLSAIGEVAQIDALDLSIYDCAHSSRRKDTLSPMEPIKAVKSGQIDKILAEVTDVLVGNFDVVLSAEHMPVAQQLLEIQHEINNSRPLEIWKEILSESNVKYSSWDAAFELSPHISKAFPERIKAFLTAKNSGFWGHLQTLMSSFKMYYIPSFDGLGKLERGDKKMLDPQLTIAISASGISLSDGSTRILAPGGVVMSTQGATSRRQESQPDPDLPRIMAYAPDPLQAGFIYQEPVPFWLLRESGKAIFNSEAGTNQASGSVNLDLNEREQRRTEGHKYKVEVDTVSEGIMTELCDITFKELQLRNSTAVLTLPLTFQWNDYIGRRATVKIKSNAEEGDGQFTAFISGITHNIDLQQGKQLKSSTEMRLSHADYR